MSEEFNSVDIRKAAGRFATGITVVTTDVDGETRGMTANSFVSVSLDPPLVLVSVANSASMYEQIKESGHYGVSVLREDQKEVSSLFAGASIEGLNPAFKQLAGVPVLDQSLATFACELHQQIVCGDHTLFVGKVLELEYVDADPLIYFSSAYQALSKAA